MMDVEKAIRRVIEETGLRGPPQERIGLLLEDWEVVTKACLQKTTFRLHVDKFYFELWVGKIP